jgi:hypothetical protein
MHELELGRSSVTAMVLPLSPRAEADVPHRTDQQLHFPSECSIQRHRPNDWHPVNAAVGVGTCLLALHRVADAEPISLEAAAAS